MAAARDGADDIRFGGHQSFALRIAWLPKAVEVIKAGGDPLTNPLIGVVELGLGKNMVEALRCWIEAYGIARRAEAGWELTPLGEQLFGAPGYDRYLEDEQTLWLLHWQIATLRKAPFFAWELLINRWNEPAFTPSAVVTAFLREAERLGRRLSEVSARQHFDVWLHTYAPARSGRAIEEGFDSPLIDLGFVRSLGDREGPSGRPEPVYGFDLTPKRSLSQALFRHCLADWWEHEYPDEDTIPFVEVALGRASPGRVFRMPESEVRERLLDLTARATWGFELVDSLNQYSVRRHRPQARPNVDLIYARTAELADA